MAFLEHILTKMIRHHFSHTAAAGQVGAFALLLAICLATSAGADMPALRHEEEVRKYIASEAFATLQTDRRCHDRPIYRVYLIDNFEQRIHLVPEVWTSHGEMLVRLLRAGRDDIDLRVLNTSLGRGLVRVILDLAAGGCVDAVVSAIPGSNYTYDQISSLFEYRLKIRPENILYHRSALRGLLRDIALTGFPSVEWLETIDVNSIKLRNDARKFAFIEALGRFNVPVILPYGNADARHRGRIKAVNLLSLAANARVYSALDQKGERVAGFPYSPLSAGDETAVFDIVECPHPDDPFKAVLDINEDGYQDYTFFRTGRIAFRDAGGNLAFAPPVTRQDVYVKWRDAIQGAPACRIDASPVLTAGQYQDLQRLCPAALDRAVTRPYVWLNAPGRERIFDFSPACWARGTISGTSVIPPHKLKELLPPKKGRDAHGIGGPHPAAVDG